MPAFLTPKPGLNSGFMIPQVTAAALVSENKQRRLSGQRRFDPDLGQPGGPCLDGRPRRPPAAAHGRERLAGIIGIELLAAAQGCDFHAPLKSSAPLEARARAAARQGAASRRSTAFPSRHGSGQCAGARRCGDRSRRRGRPARHCRSWRMKPGRGQARLLAGHSRPAAHRHRMCPPTSGSGSTPTAGCSPTPTGTSTRSMTGCCRSDHGARHLPPLRHRRQPRPVGQEPLSRPEHHRAGPAHRFRRPADLETAPNLTRRHRSGGSPHSTALSCRRWQPRSSG